MWQRSPSFVFEVNDAFQSAIRMGVQNELPQIRLQLSLVIKRKVMKIIVFIASLLLMTACTSDPKLVMHDENDKLCENHKSDFQYFQAKFDREHAEVCSSGCAYTSSMNKASDTMEHIAGLYYLMNCDLNHGRL